MKNLSILIILQIQNSYYLIEYLFFHAPGPPPLMGLLQRPGPQIYKCCDAVSLISFSLSNILQEQISSVMTATLVYTNGSLDWNRHHHQQRHNNLKSTTASRTVVLKTNITQIISIFQVFSQNAWHCIFFFPQ